MFLVYMQIQKASCSSMAYGEEARRKGTISQYFTTLHCPVCDELTQLGVCSGCRADPQRVAVTLYQDMRQWESQQDQMLQVKWRIWCCFSQVSFLMILCNFIMEVQMLECFYSDYLQGHRNQIISLLITRFQKFKYPHTSSNSDILSATKGTSPPPQKKKTHTDTYTQCLH